VRDRKKDTGTYSKYHLSSPITSLCSPNDPHGGCGRVDERISNLNDKIDSQTIS